MKAGYWLLDAFLKRSPDEDSFRARFYGVDGKKRELNTEDEVKEICETVSRHPFAVTSVKKTEKQRSPSPPFITSTLQQEASRRLNMTPRRTMAVAQQLYEGIEITGRGSIGLISYMPSLRTATVRHTARRSRVYTRQRPAPRTPTRRSARPM